MKIKSGDTLSQIAKDKGMTLKALLAANPNIKNANQIRVGQTITIPPKKMIGKSNVSDNPYKGMTRTQMNMMDQDTKANRKRLAAGKKRDRNSASNKSAEAATRASIAKSKAGGTTYKKSDNTGTSMSPKLRKLFK